MSGRAGRGCGLHPESDGVTVGGECGVREDSWQGGVGEQYLSWCVCDVWRCEGGGGGNWGEGCRGGDGEATQRVLWQ